MQIAIKFIQMKNNFNEVENKVIKKWMKDNNLEEEYKIYRKYI